MSTLFVRSLCTALAAVTLAAGCEPTETLSDPTPVAMDRESEAVAMAEALVFGGPAEIEPATPDLVGEPGSLLSQEAIPHHDPRFHDHYQEGLILLEQGDTGAAIDAFRMALFDAPDSAATWYELGAAYVAAGRRSQGVQCITEAITHGPKHEEARRFLARHWLDQGDPKRARPHADVLASVARDDFRSHYLRSRVFAGLSMWEEAIGAGRRAIALNPEFVYAYNNVGFAALQVGRDVLAVQYLEAATELTPLEPYMLNNLGIAYERMERNGDALATWMRAASLDPTYVKAIANRDRMQVIVDEEVADEVARILAERKAAEQPTDSVASGILTP